MSEANEQLELIPPLAALKDDFMAFIAEVQALGETYSFHSKAQQDFEAYLERIEAIKHVSNPDWVAQSTFWLVQDGQRILGEVRLRHKLTPGLLLEGGHIGYAIRPSARRQGYGIRQLALALERAREIGLERVLVTCDSDNLGSARIIEANGGVLESYETSLASGKQVARYWIDL